MEISLNGFLIQINVLSSFVAIQFESRFMVYAVICVSLSVQILEFIKSIESTYDAKATGAASRLIINSLLRCEINRDFS